MLRPKQARKTLTNPAPSMARSRYPKSLASSLELINEASTQKTSATALIVLTMSPLRKSRRLQSAIAEISRRWIHHVKPTNKHGTAFSAIKRSIAGRVLNQNLFSSVYKRTAGGDTRVLAPKLTAESYFMTCMRDQS